MVFSQEAIDRFWNKIKPPINDDDCWEWTAFKDKDGYGKLSLIERNRKSYNAHRFSYELHHNIILLPDQMVCHTCDNPSCVNPNHLELGDAKLNKIDSVNKNRHAHGSVHGNSVLTDEIVQNMLIKICNNEFINVNQIAAYYSIDRTVISGILTGKRWTHITNCMVIPLSQVRNMIVQTKYENALNVNKVKDIKQRLKNGETNRQIANLYNVDIHTIYEIKRGNLWSHVVI